mmetsp:Transcript_25904/g.75785  ORF Transcript_25904/g.75785 Transcript_25904/m.75785 type:complete len:163 (+) Transcript_25904:658-1146(+)
MVAIRKLQREGIAVWACETIDGAPLHWDVLHPRPLALVLGNESIGVDTQVLDACDMVVQIPCFGVKNVRYRPSRSLSPGGRLTSRLGDPTLDPASKSGPDTGWPAERAARSAAAPRPLDAVSECGDGRLRPRLGGAAPVGLPPRDAARCRIAPPRDARRGHE